MAEIKDKVQNSLDESRMLVLGVQVLLGFEFRAVLEPGFDRLPLRFRYFLLCAIAAIVAAFVLLVAPTMFHRVTERGQDTERLNRFTLSIMQWSLPIFLLAIASDLVVAIWLALGSIGALVATVLAAIGLIYLGVAEAHPFHVSSGGQDMPAIGSPPTPLKDRLRHVLTEARVVLPGVQALLGFQFIGVFLTDFDKLPDGSKLVYVLSLICLTVSTMLLMAPAAHHRLVYRGEESERLVRVAGSFVVAAMVPLGLAIALDMYVVTLRVTGSSAGAWAVAALMLLSLYVVWFGGTHRARLRSSR